jgi:hypothetical protein
MFFSCQVSRLFAIKCLHANVFALFPKILFVLPHDPGRRPPAAQQPIIVPERKVEISLSSPPLAKGDLGGFV